MAENLTQCSVCRTLISPEKVAGMQPPLLCEGCRARQATAQSSEFPFATFVRFRASVKLVATMLLVIAVFQFVALLWNPVGRLLLANMNLSGRTGYHGIENLLASFMITLPSTLLWNILFPVLLLMIRKALLAFSDMMSDLFVAAHQEKL